MAELRVLSRFCPKGDYDKSQSGSPECLLLGRGLCDRTVGFDS